MQGRKGAGEASHNRSGISDAWNLPLGVHRYIRNLRLHSPKLLENSFSVSYSVSMLSPTTVAHLQPRLIQLAARHLSPPLRQKLDSADIVQSVFRTFLRRQPSADWHWNDEHGLWNLLARITIRKCASKAEHFSQQCRDVQKETAIDGFSETCPSVISPLQDAILREEVERLHRGLSPAHQRIAQHLLQGESVAHIRACLGVPERTIQRLKQRLEYRLQERLRSESEAAG